MEIQTQTEPTHEGIEDTRAPLIAHLLELKKRVAISGAAYLLATAFCYFFADEIYGFLVAPLATASEGEQRRLIYTGLTEAFFTYLKVALFGGLVVSFPILAAQLYRFIAPGLYKQERRVAVPYLIATPALFGLGAAFAYYFVFPIAWKFFLSFETPGGSSPLPVHLEARVSEYLDLVMQLIFGFGLAFQLPVALTLLARAGFLTADTLVKKRKLAIVLIFLAAGLLTPPDVISQCSMALPLLVLYEISIRLCRMLNKQATEAEEEEDDEFSITYESPTPHAGHQVDTRKP